MSYKIWFTKGGKDVEEGISLRNGKAAISGWSTHEVWLTEACGECEIEYKIADIYCGEPINLADGFGFRIERGDESHAIPESR